MAEREIPHPARFCAPESPDHDHGPVDSVSVPSFSWRYGQSNTSGSQLVSASQNDDTGSATSAHTSAIRPSMNDPGMEELDFTFPPVTLPSSTFPFISQPVSAYAGALYGNGQSSVEPFAPVVNSTMQLFQQRHLQHHSHVQQQRYHDLLQSHDDGCDDSVYRLSPPLHPPSFYPPSLSSPSPRTTLPVTQEVRQSSHEADQDLRSVYQCQYLQVFCQGQRFPIYTSPSPSVTAEASHGGNDRTQASKPPEDQQSHGLPSQSPHRVMSSDNASLYAPTLFPSVMCQGQQRQQEQQQQNRVEAPHVVTSSFALTQSPTLPYESPSSTPVTESFSAQHSLDTTVDPAALDNRFSAPSAAGTSLHGAAWRPVTHKISKDRRTAPTTLAKTLPAWLDNHHELLPALNPAAREGLSLMLHVPEAEEMLEPSAPFSLAAETPLRRSTTPHQPLDIDGLHPGMRVVPSGEEVGIAPSMIFGPQSQERLASPENVDVTPPFMGEQFDDGDSKSNSGRSGNTFLAHDSDAGYLEISESGNDSIRSSSRQSIASARASPLPGQHAESIPAAPQQPRVKLPRPSPTPMFLASEAAWESGEDEAEDGEQVEESSSQRGLPEVGRQITDVPTVGTDSEALRGQQAERSRQDAFLVAQRRAGLTYREIRRLGGFEEAESTLRGRFRTLTKPKEERVRRPRWSEGDDQLLVSAVRRLARGGLPAVGDEAPLRISWKAVSDFIADHGGSYKFGNTTCHKRWTHLRSKGLV